MNKILSISLALLTLSWSEVMGMERYQTSTGQNVVGLRARASLKDTLAQYVSLLPLAAYSKVLTEMPQNATVEQIIFFHERAYQALLFVVKNLSKDALYYNVFDHLVNELDRAEIFARHLLYIYFENDSEQNSQSVDQISKSGNGIQAKKYLQSFNREAQQAIYLALCKLNAPEDILTSCIKLFDPKQLDHIAQNLHQELDLRNRALAAGDAAKGRTASTMRKILSQIEQLMKKEFARRCPSEPACTAFSKEFFAPITTGCEGDTSADATEFLDNFERLLNKRLDEGRLIEERVNNLMELRKTSPADFEDRVRQQFSELHESQMLFLRYLLLAWAVQDVNRVPWAAEVIAILFYGGRISKFTACSDNDLRTAVKHVLQLCEIFIKNYPGALELLRSHAETIDARTKMFKLLLSGGAQAMAELLSRYLELLAKDRVHAEEKNALSEADLCQLRETMTTLVREMPESLRVEVLAAMALPSRSKRLLLLDAPVKEEFFCNLVNLFLPYYLDEDESFIEFFSLVRETHTTAQITSNLKQLVHNYFNANKINQEKAAGFAEIMAFEFQAESNQNSRAATPEPS